MKKVMIVLILSLTASLASAKDGKRGIPEKLRQQLTEEQISQLENAETREVRRELLTSWGIEMPAPPHGKHRGPRPELDEATKTQLDALKAKYEEASTDEEKDAVRKEIRELFHASQSDDEKKGVRRFFKDHPAKGERAEDETVSAGNR